MIHKSSKRFQTYLGFRQIKRQKHDPITEGILSNFYRAMHCSAKRSIATACRLSVCDVGGSAAHRLKSCKLIERTISQISQFALRSPKTIYLLPGEYGERLRTEETRGQSLGKVVCRSTKAAISRPSTCSERNIGKFGGD